MKPVALSSRPLRIGTLGLAVGLVLLATFLAVRVGGAAADDGDITLVPGWNLVGWAGADTPIDQALQNGGIIDRVTVVWGYAGGTWSAFFPSAASVPGANDLTTFVHFSGYFIAVNGSANVVWHTGATAPTSPTSTSTPTSTQTAIPTSTPIPTATPVETTRTFGNGTFVVGSDIEPGTYRTRTATDGCYWQRLSGLGGTLDEIIANDFTNGVSVVTIAGTDAAFSSEDCAQWTSDLSAITTSPTSPVSTDGVYIVGVDVAAGTWRADAVQGCYWARLSGFSGGLGDIIANDFTNSAPVVAISASDKGFETTGCGMWTKIS